MKEIMAVFDTDIGYAKDLAGKLMNEKDFPYYVQGFSGVEELTGFLSQHAVAVLIADQKDIGPELMPFLEGNQGQETALVPYGIDREMVVIYFTEVSGYPEIASHAAVYKYQSVKMLADDILSAVERQKRNGRQRSVLTEGVRIIGVAGPVARSGRTSFCLTLGQLLSGKGKTLYMNLEPSAEFEAMFEENWEEDLSDLVYACMTSERPPDYGRFIKKFHGLDMIPPVRLPEDLYRTEPEILTGVLRRITADERYDTVLLDMGCEYRIIEALLPMLNKLFIPTRRDKLSVMRTRMFREWVLRVDEKADLMAPEELILPQPKAFLTGKAYIEQLLWSETGDYVRALLERET